MHNQSRLETPVISPKVGDMARRDEASTIAATSCTDNTYAVPSLPAPPSPPLPLPLPLPLPPPPPLCRSVAVSDAILVAQSAFAGGEFQPEAFPRCVCLLLEAFEGGDNAVRLCTARLIERYRPHLGGSILSVEVGGWLSEGMGW